MDSHLQIISGKERGRRLAMPPAARPTQNRSRIALFNMMDSLQMASSTSNLKLQTSNLVVWDAFAGSGAFGIEFLSRSAAKSVIFTDVDTESVKTVHKNLVGIDGDVIVRKADALDSAAQFGKIADIIFIDPPYALFETGERLVAKLSEIARKGAVIVWEMPKNARPKIAGNLVVLKDKTYGAARFLILRLNE